MFRQSTFKTVLIVLTLFLGTYFTLPTMLGPDTMRQIGNVLPTFLVPKSAVKLGLDLQGGVHVMLEADKPGLIKDLVRQLQEDVRRVLRTERVAPTGGIVAQTRGVSLRITDAAQRTKVFPKLQELATPVTNAVIGNTGQRSLEIVDLGDGLIQMVITDAEVNERVRRATDQSIEIFRKRIDPDGVKEPSIQRQGLERIVVQVPGAKNSKEITDVLQPGKLEFRMVAEPGANPSEIETLVHLDEGGGTIQVERRVLVRGEDLTSAEPGFDQRNSEPIVNFRFNVKGAQAFAKATTENVGKPFAIILDNKVVSAPRIISPITQGQGQISGRFTVEAANRLSILLRSGALPASFTLVEERTVGPGLGRDSIAAAALASTVSAAAIAVFTVATYGIFGVIALLALVVNVVLIFACMALIGSTLTLPGIAGIVLTVAVAVDSNVLIYERIREEQMAGRSAISALDSGFTRALATVLDANVTGFLAHAILYFVGTGPVKGFAVTTCIGIATTIFTAFTLTRIMVGVWYRVFRPKVVPI
ncbi:MAG: preprotein translocase subunit [Beijerinckiaceae bacterium]|nr:MAG: preprotein translocase subunit [Beijerinckiaceae bacterium]